MAAKFGFFFWLMTVCLWGVVGFSVSAVSQDIPSVLIVGDRVYQQPAAELTKRLKGKVEVVFAKIEAGELRNSSTALTDLPRLLGKRKWDLIHFNFGLGDLVHRAPGMQAFRVMAREAGGIRATSPANYEANLRKLVSRLKTTGAKLVWASTTPIRHSTTNVFEKGSEVQYNRIADKVMSEFGIPVNDMYSFVRDLIDMDRPASHGADPFHFDRKPIYPPIMKSISRHLEIDLTEPTQNE